MAGVGALAPYLGKGQGLAVAVLPYDGRGVMAGELRFSQDLRQIEENLRRISLGQQSCGAAPASDCGASAALRQAAQLLDQHIAFDPAQPEDVRQDAAQGHAALALKRRGRVTDGLLFEYICFNLLICS